MNKSVFIFIESNTSGTGDLFFRRVQELQIQPILLSAAPSLYHFSFKGLKYIQTDTSSEEALTNVCKRIRKQNKLAGIASSSDYFVEMAARLARRFHLPGPDPDAISLCRNKENQRLALFGAGIGLPKYKKVVSVEEAVNSAIQIGFPVVIKPVSGSGSVGVQLCREPDEVVRHSKILLSRTVNERGILAKNEILVEQYIDGDEYSVETFGKEVVGITKKHLSPEPYFVEIGHDFPAFIPTETKSAISRTVLKSLKILKLDWGPSHTEIRLNDQGIFIIEVNPRLAGGFIPELIRYSFGIDLIAETITLFLGRHARLTPAVRFYSSIRFILPLTNGTLAKVEGLNNAGRLNGIEEISMYKTSGEKVANFGDFRARIGHIIAKGESSPSACETVNKAHRMIRLVINSASFSEK